MGQHNFLDGNNFSVIRIVSEDLDTGIIINGSGFIVQVATEYHRKDGPIFLVSNRNTLSERTSRLSIEFHEQQRYVHSGDIEKKSVVELKDTANKIVGHLNQRIDLACLKLPKSVTAKFINGVNPFFNFDENLRKISPIPSYLSGNSVFSSCHLFPNSEKPSSVPFIQRYKKDSKSEKRTMYYDVGSPVMEMDNKEVKWFFCPVAEKLKKTMDSASASDVRELIEYAKKGAGSKVPQYPVARIISVPAFV